MTEARHKNSNREFRNSQRSSRPAFAIRPAADQIGRLLNLRQIEQEYGLNEYHVYKAAHDGRLHPMQLGGKGRIYYAEWEVRTLISDSYSLRRVA